MITPNQKKKELTKPSFVKKVEEKRDEDQYNSSNGKKTRRLKRKSIWDNERKW